MTLVLAGQLVGIAFACGVNLYLTVATLGILARLGFLAELPGLQGLEGLLIIGSAIALYVVELVVDKVSHADSLWDAVHTLIRPPAAALLAVAILWGEPATVMALGAALTLSVAFLAHTAKSGLRLSLNATLRTRWHSAISVVEDLLALALAVAALTFPLYALAAVGVLLLAVALFWPRLWRAFRLGYRAMAAWLRSIFTPRRWRELPELPRDLQPLLDDTPVGGAPPRGTRAALHGVKGVGPFRNGWLVLTVRGPAFVYRTIFGVRRVDLPTPEDLKLIPGVWAHVVESRGDGGAYTLFLMKDGPEIDMALQQLSAGTL